MAEIKRPLKKLAEGVPYTPGPEEYVITEDNSLADVLRLLVELAKGSEDLIYLLNEYEADEE